MKDIKRNAFALAGCLIAVTSLNTRYAEAATEIYTARAAFDARVAVINNLGLASLSLETQSFEESIPGSDTSDRTGPASFTYRDVPMAVSAGGFGLFRDNFSTTGGTASDGVSALGYQANGGSAAPLVVETSVPVHALGFDITGFGSQDIDPFFICFQPDYALEFTGGDLAAHIVDTESANGNSNPQNIQFFGIIDVDSPFTQIELNNTGFFEGAVCGFSGTEPDVGDTINIDRLSFGVAQFEPDCGDVDGNRMIDNDDVNALRNALAGLGSLAAPDNCSVRGGADDCDILDAVVIARSADMPASLPGIAEVCRSNNPPPSDLATNLVGYWPFDDTQANAVNYSPRGLRVNAQAGGDASRTTGAVGSSALNLPDVTTDGFVEVTDPAGQALLTASDDMTIVTWINPAGAGASPVLGGTILSKAGEYDLFRLPSGALRWQRAFGDQPADVDFGVSAFVTPLGEWTHIAMVFDFAEARLYVNGTFQESWPITPGFSDNVPGNNTLRIGSSSTAAGRQYDGAIDETAIWLRALSDSDIDHLYDNGFGRRAHELRVLAANLDYDTGSVWSVTETAAAPFAVTTNTMNLGDVQLQLNGAPLYADAGVLISTVRETRDLPSSNLRLSTVYAAADNSLWATMTDLDGAPVEVNARISVAYFPFAEGWIGGHVAANGTLTIGNGIVNANVTRTGVGIYRVSIPGVTDARSQGMLYAVDANNTQDNLVMTNPDGATWKVISYDNDQNFGSGQDVAWSFVYIPYDAPNLTAAEIDQLQTEINGTGTSLATELSPGITEITVPGEHYRRGVLLLGAGFTPDNPQDNLYTYAPGGSGRFVSHSRDLPAEGLQRAQYSYAYISFDRPVEMP